MTHCGNWMWPIEESLVQLCNDVGAEIIVLTDRKKPGSFEIIDLDHLSEKHQFRQMLGRNSGCIRLPEELFDRQYAFEKQQKRYQRIKRDKLRLSMTLWCRQAEALFEVIEPDLFIVWNGQFGIGRVFRFVAEQLAVPVCFAEKGVLPQSWYLDRQGINATSSIGRDFCGNLEIGETQVETFQEKIRKIDQTGASAWRQPERKDGAKIRQELGVKKGQKVVFFPGQVDSDSNILLFSSHFKRSLDVLSWLAQGTGQDHFILAKPHPKGMDKQEDFAAVLGGEGRSITDMNVLDAIAVADVVVTINSTVAFEAIIRGTPVLQLGDGILTGKGLVAEYDPQQSAREQINKCLAEHQEKGEEIAARALRFGAYLNNQYYSFRFQTETARIALDSILVPLEVSKKSETHHVIVSRFSALTADTWWRFFRNRILLEIWYFLLRVKIVGVKAVKLLLPGLVTWLKKKLVQRASSAPWSSGFVMQHEVYSFDVFDTVLTRTVASPRALFELVQSRLSSLHSLPRQLVRRFPDIRIKAERRARLCATREETTLDEIYQKIADEHVLEAVTIEEIKALELETELECASPIALILEEIHRLKGAGKRVIYTSDIYLPQSHILKMLEKVGAPVDTGVLYVSSEIGLRKSSGSLFYHILENEGCSVKNLYHFGDNDWADLLVPARIGIRIYRTPGREVFAKRLRFSLGGAFYRSRRLLSKFFETNDER